ncbi:Arabinogalactan O-methyltransferase 2 [Cardamine amara subsp. amara]|uniref:Arabinogalactan O-methyltransferase 2 n=1 Tax=Cardamine amara subsp. amara TaxID=228776 RepID=A0ABD1A306_CARAN
MPPQLYQSSLPILNPLLRFSPPSSPDNPKHQKESKIKMPKFTVRKLIPLLIFVLSSLSVLRLLRISYKSSSSASWSSSSATFRLSPAESSQLIKANVGQSVLTEKELKLLSDTVTRRSPCNVLVFGFAPQYLMLSSINTRGINVILEDEAAKIMTPKVNPNNTIIYSLKYHLMEVKNAYNLLRHARANPACAPKMNNLHQRSSDCKLELKDLPQKVHNTKWDVIVVDGPRGDDLEAPGRMGTIYTAAVLARKGSSNSTTDVLVHDVQRTAEKWLSWEFLCQENQVSAKGNFWKFRIKDQSNASRFCSPETVLIRH